MLVELDSLSLMPSGPSLTLSVPAGRTVGIFGPAASGKSRLLRAICGIEKPVRGSVRLRGEATMAETRGLSKRLTPATIAKKAAGASGATRAAEALTALRLWDVRSKALLELADAELEACLLLDVLASPDPILGIDGLLDGLDPWTLGTVLELLSARLRSGSVLVMSTNRPEFAHRFDTMVVVKEQSVVFAGTYSDLERKQPVSEIVVETHHQPGVRAIVAPFEVQISKSAEGVVVRAKEGQKIAAKLLTEGYGDIKAVIVRQPSAEEMLRSLLT